MRRFGDWLCLLPLCSGWGWSGESAQATAPPERILKTSALYVRQAVADEGTIQLRIRECVYKAEVHGLQEQSQSELKAILAGKLTPELRREVVTALGVIKKGNAKLGLKLEKPLEQLREPQAVVVFGGETFLLLQNKWLELGDWVGPFFLYNISLAQLTLRHEDGHLREVSLPSPPNWENRIPPATGALILNARLTDLLGFAARKEGLNFFIPSDMKEKVSGYYPMRDWLSFLDSICQSSNVRWTRHLDNILFRPADRNQLKNGRIAHIDQQNQNLGSFLSQLAEQFSMELVLADPSIADVELDLHLQEQPWDEVLDCLSIMNGLNWSLDRRAGERPRLTIHRQ